MDFRTDLALERCEILGKTDIPGVETEVFRGKKARVSRIKITSTEGEKAIGKPMGEYVTVEVAPFAKQAQFIDDSLEALCNEIKRLLPEKGGVLVAGLGNRKITPDAFGPDCASMIFATRHITGELLRSTGLEGLREVSPFSTDVTGNTGAQAGEIIKGVVSVLKPAVVITVDALAARSVSRLGSTVQMCSTGIVPGSGVGNARQEISEKTVGVPVIAIGVPTVVDAGTLVADYAGNDELKKSLPSEAVEMMVTPREVDLMIERAAKLTALAVNCALQPDISPEDMLILTA